jgi:hypothetical protein
MAHEPICSAGKRRHRDASERVRRDRQGVTVIETDPPTRAEAESRRLEDAEDRAAIIEHRTREAALGTATARADYLPAPLVARLVDGEHPLRIWREHRGLTVAWLAKRAGIQEGDIRTIERREQPAARPTMTKLAQALGIALDDLAWPASAARGTGSPWH